MSLQKVKDGMQAEDMIPIDNSLKNNSLAGKLLQEFSKIPKGISNDLPGPATQKAQQNTA